MSYTINIQNEDNPFYAQSILFCNLTEDKLIKSFQFSIYQRKRNLQEPEYSLCIFVLNEEQDGQALRGRQHQIATSFLNKVEVNTWADPSKITMLDKTKHTAIECAKIIAPLAKISKEDQEKVIEFIKAGLKKENQCQFFNSNQNLAKNVTRNKISEDSANSGVEKITFRLGLWNDDIRTSSSDITQELGDHKYRITTYLGKPIKITVKGNDYEATKEIIVDINNNEIIKDGISSKLLPDNLQVMQQEKNRFIRCGW